MTYSVLELPARKAFEAGGVCRFTMDLTVINGLGPARREKLEAAGVSSLADLAGSDPAKLAETADIPEGVLEGFHEQAKALAGLADLDGLDDDAFQALADEGIRSSEALASADASELSEPTGLEAKRIEAWQAEISGAAAKEPASTEHARDLAEGAREAGEIALKGLGQARVVLQEGITDAKVKFQDDVLAEARILPVKAKDDVDRMLEDLKGNVVVLQEKADTALVRVEDQVVEGLPIFKEKVSEAGKSAAEGVDEVRVRVQEIRDKRVLPEAEKLTEKIKSLFKKN